MARRPNHRNGLVAEKPRAFRVVGVDDGTGRSGDGVVNREFAITGDEHVKDILQLIQCAMGPTFESLNTAFLLLLDSGVGQRDVGTAEDKNCFRAMFSQCTRNAVSRWHLRRGGGECKYR